MPARLGVDIGGTFTDLVVIDEATGTARVGKVLTTPKDPAHEARLVALAHEAIPGVFVSCSSEVVPEIREYERASTTCANVYVAPLMARYLEDLERRLAGLGIPGQLYIMQSSGGIAVS